jgi:hypothetical protein
MSATQRQRNRLLASALTATFLVMLAACAYYISIAN